MMADPIAWCALCFILSLEMRCGALSIAIFDALNEGYTTTHDEINDGYSSLSKTTIKYCVSNTSEAAYNNNPWMDSF